MRIKLLGVRGSLPTPINNEDYRKKIKKILQRAVKSGLKKPEDINDFINKLPDDLQFNYGGNTTCVSVTSNTGKIYVIDAGSGIRALGDELMKGDFGKGKGELPIFITHVHWDHIQGLPFFKPVYIPGNVLHFHSPYQNLHDCFKKQMSAPFFPATYESTGSTKKYTLLKPGKTLQLEDDFFVDCFSLNHPNESHAYRFREGNRVFIFATDVEFTGESIENVQSENDFFMNADLLVMDSQYTLDESFNKFTWGHTSYTMAVNCGIRWKTKRLVLTHHEPAYNDDKLRSIARDAVRHRNSMKLETPAIDIAREGMEFEL